MIYYNRTITQGSIPSWSVSNIGLQVILLLNSQKYHSILEDLYISDVHAGVVLWSHNPRFGAVVWIHSGRSRANRTQECLLALPHSCCSSGLCIDYGGEVWGILPSLSQGVVDMLKLIVNSGKIIQDQKMSCKK